MKKCLYDSWCNGDKKAVNNFTDLLFRAFQAADGTNRAKILKQWSVYFEGSENV